VLIRLKPTGVVSIGCSDNGLYVETECSDGIGEDSVIGDTPYPGHCARQDNISMSLFIARAEPYRSSAPA
jgi:hypothetical protein